MKAHGGRGYKVHIFAATALGRYCVTSCMFAHIYPRQIPNFILKKVTGSQNQFEYGVKKNLLPSPRHTGSNPGHPARKQAPCNLSHLTHRAYLGLVNYNI